MRGILFRGKDKDDGNWYEGYYLQLHDTTYCCLPSDNVVENEHHYIVFERMTDWGLPNKHLRAEVLPETVCQYTGLVDKKGRKIFEGDIIEVCTFGFNPERFITEVEYDKCAFRLKNGRNMFYYGQSDFTRMDDAKVIGNIFDNPELLEGAQ